MTIDKARLKALAEAATQYSWSSDAQYVIGASGLDEIVIATCSHESACQMENAAYIAEACPETILALLAENERLNKALREVMAEVDLNIRETVRDCVNGLPDVQDIYGYCDRIETIIEGAL